MKYINNIAFYVFLGIILIILCAMFVVGCLAAPMLASG